MTVSDSMPRTGAPVAGLIGLAVAVLAAGLLLRRRSKRVDIQPEEA
jgi:LPXTG-motif cell wall-anchored protein